MEDYLQLSDEWDAYIPQLKLYSNINLNTPQLEEENLNQLLYEMGMNLPLGSSKDDGELSPVKNYYNSIVENNVLQIYKNWGAISLFDSFTRISCNYPDEFSTWENDYFLIYIHVLKQVTLTC